jgi:hypothetical protein
MNARKSELRDVVLDIIFDREKVTYDPSQFTHLVSGVAEVLGRRASGSRSGINSLEYGLNDGDKTLVEEIFWDLFTERVITLGLDAVNIEFPWFRLHSDAAANLKRATSRNQ